MFTADKNYTYNRELEGASVSVYPVLPVLSESSLHLNIPEAEHKTGIVFSVRSAASSAYRWLKPTSRHFAEILITVSAFVKCAVKRVRRFIRNAAGAVRSSLTFRQTVCLRL